MRPHDPDPARLRRDLAALAFIAVGLVGLLTTAFLVHPFLGAAGTSAVSLTIGLVLGIERGGAQ